MRRGQDGAAEGCGDSRGRGQDQPPALDRMGEREAEDAVLLRARGDGMENRIRSKKR